MDDYRYTETRFGPRGRRIGAALVGLIVAVVTVLTAAAPSSAATAHPEPIGHTEHIVQEPDGTLVLIGWAFDQGMTYAPDLVEFVINGHVVEIRTSLLRTDVNSQYRVTGNHGFRYYRKLGKVSVVEIYAMPLIRGEVKVRIGLAYLNGYNPNVKGPTVVADTQREIGAPYVSGAAGPSAFDCSGLVEYVYRQAGVASLPHSAEAQRETVHLIPASSAQPGDLVFYLSGGYAYHVAIYTGAGHEIAAATPSEGVVYESIWSSAIQFGTLTH
jgi:hypothetical protein